MKIFRPLSHFLYVCMYLKSCDINRHKYSINLYLMLCYIFLISNKLAYTTPFKVTDDYYSFNSSLKTATRRSFKAVYLNYYSKPLPITKKKTNFYAWIKPQWSSWQMEIYKRDERDFVTIKWQFKKSHRNRDSKLYLLFSTTFLTAKSSKDLAMHKTLN